MLFAGWILKKHLVLLEQFDELNEKVDACLEVVDHSHSKLSKLLKTPVLFDDPIVVEMVQSAKAARDSLLFTANKLAEPNEE
jgi:hypothetical protein